jgi:hypothetical protein
MTDDNWTDEERDILGIEGDDLETDLEREPDDPSLNTDEGKEGDDKGADPDKADDGEGKTEQPAEGPEYTLTDGFLVYKNGEKIPVDRFEKLYWQQKEQERKLELLRTQGPEAYYKEFPDEAPEGYQPTPEGWDGQGLDQTDPLMGLGESPINGGPYDGWTLNQVYEVNPAAGNILLFNHLATIHGEAEAKEAADRQYVTDAENEATALSNTLAQELYGVKELAALKPDQVQKVDAEVTRTIEWMQKENKLHLNVSDAYYLMERENIIKKARTEGAKETIASITRPSVPSIRVGTGTQAPSSDLLDDMTEDELADYIGALSERQYEAFMRNASPTLRSKLPDLPWA